MQSTIRAKRFKEFVDKAGLHMLFQPIVDLRRGKAEGFEALARVAKGTLVDLWQQADSKGWRTELEIECIQLALQQMDQLPEGAYLSVNASPEVVTSPRFQETIRDSDPSRVVIEVTEESRVDNYQELHDAVEPLIREGARLALDDVGAGFNGISHIMRLMPQVLKLDISVTQNIHRDPKIRALAAALAIFAREADCKVIAEGIETKRDVKLLRELGITRGQGFFYGRPGDVTQRTLRRGIRSYLTDSVQDLVLVWRRVLRRRLVSISSLSFITAVLLLGPVATALAENARPGETLWHAKLALEEFRLAIESDQTQKVALSLEFAARRVGELSSLAMSDDAGQLDSVVDNFADHAVATAEVVDRLNQAGAAASESVADELARQTQVLGALASSACGGSEGNPHCKPLEKAAKSAEKALESVKARGTPKVRGGEPAGGGVSQAPLPGPAKKAEIKTPGK